jgi:Domain of unknown function (DUF4833)
MKMILGMLVALISMNSMAGELFTVKKSHNPRNVLHFKANISDCKITSITSNWIMGEDNGQSQGLNFFEKKQFTPRIITMKDHTADFTMGALTAMRDKLPTTTIRVELVNCVPKAIVDIGNQEVILDQIYVDGQLSGLSWNTNYMTLTGKYPDGRAYVKKFEP